MAFPETALENDEVDALYGGQPGSLFGALAWTWANNVLRHLERAHLLHNRQPFRSVVAKVYTDLAVGDVAVVVYDASGATNPDPAVRRLITGDDTLYAAATLGILGVCVQAAGVGGKAVVAIAGIVPRLYTGIATSAAGIVAAGDLSTGRVRASFSGDTILLGALDTRGNLHLR